MSHTGGHDGNLHVSESHLFYNSLVHSIEDVLTLKTDTSNIVRIELLDFVLQDDAVPGLPAYVNLYFKNRAGGNESGTLNTVLYMTDDDIGFKRWNEFMPITLFSSKAVRARQSEPKYRLRWDDAVTNRPFLVATAYVRLRITRFVSDDLVTEEKFERNIMMV